MGLFNDDDDISDSIWDVNRTYCDTLREMRAILKRSSVWTWHRDRKILYSLVEECQTYGNRMEAGLDYKRDLNYLHEERKKLREQVKTLKEERKALGGEEE